MKEQIDGTCISYQETACICNIAAPKIIWKEMAALRKKHNIFTKSMRIEKEFAEDECKRLQQELTKTKQALDKAIWWLNEIVENHRFTPISTAEKALKEITALEQKN